MNSSFAKLPAALFLAAACAISTGASAQSAQSAQSNAKHDLAVRLAHIQQKANGGSMAEQITDSAVQPLLATWSQRLDETVPPARQQEVRDKLSAELKKFTDTMQSAINEQVDKTAETTLVPIFMDKLTEDEMKTIIAYLESPVSAKFQAMGPDASDAWAKRVIDATKPTWDANARNFDATANRIVNEVINQPRPAASPASAPTGNAASRKK